MAINIYEQINSFCSKKKFVQTTGPDGKVVDILEKQSGEYDVIIRNELVTTDIQEDRPRTFRGRLRHIVDLALYDIKCNQLTVRCNVTETKATQQSIFTSWKQTDDYSGPPALPSENTRGIASIATREEGPIEPISVETADYIGKIILNNREVDKD